MSEQRLWLSRLAEGVEVRATMEHLHAAQDSGALFGAELRITIEDQLVLRELFVNERPEGGFLLE